MLSVVALLLIVALVINSRRLNPTEAEIAGRWSVPGLPWATEIHLKSDRSYTLWIKTNNGWKEAEQGSWHVSDGTLWTRLKKDLPIHSHVMARLKGNYLDKFSISSVNRTHLILELTPSVTVEWTRVEGQEDVP